MINVGDNNISGVYIGDTELSVYVGDELIYPLNFGTLTAITITNLTWVEDIPWSGGTGTSANCTYLITGYYDSGKTRKLNSKSTVLGEITASSTTSETRDLVGTLVLTATCSGLSATGSVQAYQEQYNPMPKQNEIWYTTSDQQILIPVGLTPTSNTYTTKGVMSFASNVTAIPTNFLTGHTNLTSIHLPDSVISIGNFAFMANNNLTSATIYEGLTTIGTYIFLNTNLVEFGWPASVTRLFNDYCGQFWNSGSTWDSDTLTHTLRLNAQNLGNVSCWGNLRLNQIIFSENVTGAGGTQVFYIQRSGVKATGLTDIWFEHKTTLPSEWSFWSSLEGNYSFIPTTGTIHLVQGVDETNLNGKLTGWTRVYYTP